MMNSKIFFTLFILLTLVSCKDRYDIPVKSSDQIMLVVEGVLNSNGLTTITLTSTFKLDDTAKLRPVLQAQVTVEGNDNTVAPLISAGSTGRYTGNLNLLLNREYRLRIRTTNGKEYLSAFVPVKNTPAIDSISWKQEAGGVRIFANTHDQNNNTVYYRWDYDETWEIRSYYYSRYKFVNGHIIERNLINDDVSVCWKHASSTNIIVGSSAQLQSDVIFENPLVFIPKASEKLSVRYSVLVRQYALEKKAYEYFKIMKTNTESLGTIFDAQPSEMRGNIQCITDPAEIVIGYITASDIEQKRIFINVGQLSNWGFSLQCTSLEIPNHVDSIKNYVPYPYLPYEAILSSWGSVSAYMVGTPVCVDCTTRGGSTTKPSFW